MKKIVPESASLIPDNAAKVFDGVLFDVYQWPQKMFDGSMKTFEMIKRVDTALVIAIKDNKLVTVKVKQPGIGRNYFDFPGGRKDKHDTDLSMLEVAQRELKEETGLEYKNWNLVHVHQLSVKIEGFFYWYVADILVAEGEQQYEDDGEQIDVNLMSLDEVKQHIINETDYAYLLPIFKDVDTLDDLRNMPEFKGKEVDR